MKKINGKLVVSAIIAAAMMSMTAVSAGAINYSGTGTPTTPTPVVSPTVSDNDVSDANKDNDEKDIDVKEDADGNVPVQEAAIAEIANGDAPVTFDIESDDGIDYSITIDPALVKEAKAINLAMDITVDAKVGTKASGVEIPAGSIVIDPKQKGEFGMTLQVNLPASALAGIDQATAKLYYINDKGEVTQMPDSALKFNADGSASVFIDHASQYVISSVSILLEGDSQVDSGDATVVPDTGDNDGTVVDAGKQSDTNPHTGVALALGALAASAAAVAITAKKRK